VSLCCIIFLYGALAPFRAWHVPSSGVLNERKARAGSDPYVQSCQGLTFEMSKFIYIYISAI
jgi:hypothetical protein